MTDQSDPTAAMLESLTHLRQSLLSSRETLTSLQPPSADGASALAAARMNAHNESQLDSMIGELDQHVNELRSIVGSDTDPDSN